MDRIILQVLAITLGTVLIFVWFKSPLPKDLILQMLIAVLVFDLIFFFAPLLFLFYNHLRFARGRELKYDKVNGTLHYRDDQNSLSFKVADISFKELVVTPSSYDKRVDWVFWGKYHYAVIEINNRRIAISCLLCDQVQEILGIERSNWRKKFLPAIGKNEA